MRLSFKANMVQKISLISLICLTIPSLLFSSYLSRKQSKDFYARLIEEQLATVSLAVSNADTTLHSISQLALDLAYSDSLTNYLGRMLRTDLSRYPVWTKQLLGDTISSIKYSLKYRDLGINAANIYVPGTLSQEGNYFYQIDRLYDLSFFQDYIDSGEYYGLYYLDQDETRLFRSVCGYPAATAEQNIFLFLCRIEKYPAGECLGYILFECSPQKILSPLYASRGQEKDYYVWFHSSEKGYGQCPPADVEELLVPRKEKAFFFYDAGKPLYVCCGFEHFDITVIHTSSTPISPYTLPNLSLPVILAFFALLQFVILTLFVRRSFLQLHQDLSLMDAIIAHGFKEKIPVKRTDEIGMIEHRYNILLEKISSLISENVRRETAQAQAQLKALQYQINPHFIYNTLNVFSGCASQNGQYALADSIASFGQLLRYTIKNDGIYTTIDAELSNAASLIKVYNIRYLNRLQLSVEVPGELRQLQIIRFLFQPLLENAILHGLSQNTVLHIRIALCRTGSFIRIAITDDGEGMSPERLQEVAQYMADPSEAERPFSPKGSFIGLKNIYQRLKLFYGPQAELTIQSQIQQGTKVSICIPADS